MADETAETHPECPWWEFIENCKTGDNYFRLSDYCRLQEELLSLRADLATLIEARDHADQIGRVQPDNWLTESDDYRRGASDTILRYAPLIRSLSPTPNQEKPE